MNEVKLYFLVNGMIIVAEQENETPAVYVVKEPRVLIQGPSGLSLGNFSKGITDTPITVLKKDHVLFSPCTPRVQLQDAYREITSSIIVKRGLPS